MRAGENITYPAPGYMRVTLPFHQVKDEGNEVIGYITLTEHADLHLMDPDAAFVKDDTGIYYYGFKKVTKVEIEIKRVPTHYIYKSINNKTYFCDVQRIKLGEELINNKTCPLCRAEPLHTVSCAKLNGWAVCEEHCSVCEHHKANGCRYVKKSVDKPP